MRGQKFKYGLLILLLGVAAAWPYYRGADQPQQESATTIAIAEPVVQNVDTNARVTAPIVSLSSGPTELPGSIVTPSPPPPPLVTLPDWTRTLPPPPSIDTSSPPIPPVMPVFARRRESNPITPNISEPTAKVTIVPTEPPRIRRHCVVDGDSLRILALRYYGDEQGAAWILSANRSLLGDGSLLPVGKELVIPPKTVP